MPVIMYSYSDTDSVARAISLVGTFAIFDIAATLEFDLFESR
jgi:hypothetical protein